MIHALVQAKVQQWLLHPQCPAKHLLDYIAVTGQLRSPQQQAIATYLFLLYEGKNKSLSQLWADGLFNQSADYSRSAMAAPVRTLLESNQGANTWYQWALSNQPDLATHWASHADSVNFDQLTERLFYGWQYTDYLFSLPMGAGKTWLMASIIYLNLHLHLANPDDPRFARNFALLIPSGKLTSLLPSLRSIQRFNPAWLLPPDAAQQVAALLKFEVLDASKSAARSNRTRNPNAQKINQHAPFETCTGLVLVVNAEKVIIDRVEDRAQAGLLERTDADRLAALNELRQRIGSIPGLQIHIDEVQYAAHDDIKLRQVVQGWSAGGSIHSVLGYSGTPYHESPLRLDLAPFTLRIPNISTVVYHYPLVTAVELFLKRPTIKTIHEASSQQIVEQGVREFLAIYGQTVYTTDDGSQLGAKLAIYCGTIARLETEVYPQLRAMGVADAQILRFHRGNKEFPAHAQAETQFLALDTPASAIQIVLLVQIGKEGWDCKSLTGVVLSQAGDSPRNMVLQTSCRCLREVQRGVRHSAHIWLNEANAKELDAELKKTQGTSIAQLNAAAQRGANDIQQVSRQAVLQVPLVTVLDLKLNHQTIALEAQANTEAKLQAALAHAQSRMGYSTEGAISLQGITQQINSVSLAQRGAMTTLDAWLNQLCKDSFGLLGIHDFAPWHPLLNSIHQALLASSAYDQTAQYFDTSAPVAGTERLIRLAFWQLRSLQSELLELSPNAQLALLKPAGLKALEASTALFPDRATYNDIAAADANPTANVAQQAQAVDEAYAAALALIAQRNPAALARQMTLDQTPPNQNLSTALRYKDSTLHYMPYAFSQSGFEKRFLEQALGLQELADQGLELFYNGARELTEFQIQCYQQTAAGGWARLGKYTPDFVLLKRTADRSQVHQLMMIETKGRVFASFPDYIARKRYVQSEFLQRHASAFGYAKFDFLELLEPETASTQANLGAMLMQLRARIGTFFVNA